MSKRVELWDEVRSQHDAIEFARGRGAKVVSIETSNNHKSSYTKVETPKGAVHLNDCCRAMPKQERELVRFWMWGLGLLVAVILSAPLWLVRVMQMLDLAG